MVCGTEFALVEDVDDVWPAIDARALCSCAAPDVLRDIRRRCRSGDALCLQGPDGVVILAIEPRDDAATVVKVLLAVSAGQQGVFERQESAMLAIARDIGASELVFETDRRGWVRLLGPQWHKHDDGTFTRGV